MNSLKCNVCNIVIDELLAYVQNKISVIDEETLKRICVSAFTDSEINKSKALLFDSLPTVPRKILRKGSKKKERDLDDIISVFKSVDPDEIPVFVARVLEKLPPILFDHLDCTKLLKDLTKLSSEIAEIKTTYVTMQQFEELRLDIHNLKYASLPPRMNPISGYVNMKRGAWNMSSGPVGLSLDDGHNISISNDSCENIKMRVDEQIDRKSIETQRPPELEQASVARGSSAGGVRTARSMSHDAVEETRTSWASASELTPRASSPLPRPQSEKRREASDCDRGDGEKRTMSVRKTRPSQNKDDEGWQTVRNRKRPMKYRFLGRTGVARDLLGTFRAAERKIPMFITNVHTSATEGDIIKYIFSKTKETVSLEKINMKFQRGHNAYKFFISESNLPMYTDEKLWPAGIIFRRFVNFKNRSSNSATTHTADGLKLTKNG